MSEAFFVGPSDLREAKRLVKSIAAELAAGTRHFSERDGRELRTVAEVVRELLEHGHLELELKHGRQQPDYLGPPLGPA